MYDAALLSEEVAAATERGTYTLTITSPDAPPAGRVLRACGACEALGNWDVTAAPELTPLAPVDKRDAGKWPEGASTRRPVAGVLAARVALPAGRETEFKLVECDPDGGAPRWQARRPRAASPGAAPSASGADRMGRLAEKERGHAAVLPACLPACLYAVCRTHCALSRGRVLRGCALCVQEGDNVRVDVWTGVARPTLLLSLGSGDGSVPEGALAVSSRSANAQSLASKTLGDIVSVAQRAVSSGDRRRRKSAAGEGVVPRAAALESMDALASFDEDDTTARRSGRDGASRGDSSSSGGGGGFLDSVAALFGSPSPGGDAEGGRKAANGGRRRSGKWDAVADAPARPRSPGQEAVMRAAERRARQGPLTSAQKAERQKAARTQGLSPEQSARESARRREKSESSERRSAAAAAFKARVQAEREDRASEARPPSRHPPRLACQCFTRMLMCACAALAAMLGPSAGEARGSAGRDGAEPARDRGAQGARGARGAPPARGVGGGAGARGGGGARQD